MALQGCMGDAVFVIAAFRLQPPRREPATAPPASTVELRMA
jgi:hypothetical protein